MPLLEPLTLHRFSPARADLPPEWTTAPDLGGLAPEERELYAQKSPYNVVNAGLPGDEGQPLLRQWLAQGALTAMEPALLFMAADMAEGGAVRTVHGLWGGAALDDPWLAAVERTMPEAEDRALTRLESLGAQASPVLAATRGLEPLLARLAGHLEKRPPLLRMSLGDVGYRFWSVSEVDAAGLHADMTRDLDGIPALVVDGQHRLAAMRRHFAQAGPGPWQALVCLCPAGQLRLEPFHRVLTWHRKLDWERILAAAEADFHVQPAADPAALAAAAPGSFLLALPSTLWLLMARSGSGSSGPDAGARLVDDLFLQGLLGLVDSELECGELLDVTTSAEQAATLVAQGAAQAAFIVRPVGLDALERAAAGGALLPPRTILARPKPPCGLFYAFLA